MFKEQHASVGREMKKWGNEDGVLDYNNLQVVIRTLSIFTGMRRQTDIREL